MNRRSVLKAMVITPFVVNPKLFDLTNKNSKYQKKCIIGIGNKSSNIIDDMILMKKNNNIEFVQMNRDLESLKTRKVKKDSVHYPLWSFDD